jgi:hypothetical protein
VTTTNLAELVATAERVSKNLEARGAEYLYDGVYAYHDSFQYWLCTETGDEVALEPRTLNLFLAFVKRREAR